MTWANTPIMEHGPLVRILTPATQARYGTVTDLPAGHARPSLSLFFEVHLIDLFWLATNHVYTLLNPRSFGPLYSVMSGSSKGQMQWFFRPDSNNWKGCSEKLVNGFCNLLKRRFCRYVELIRLHISHGKAVFVGESLKSSVFKRYPPNCLASSSTFIATSLLLP